MSIKTNPYSDALRAALQTVAEISSPDYILMPIEPTPQMVRAGVEADYTLSEAEVRKIYAAMVARWVDDLPR